MWPLVIEWKLIHHNHSRKFPLKPFWNFILNNKNVFSLCLKFFKSAKWDSSLQSEIAVCYLIRLCNFNYCITWGELSDELQKADVIPVHIKNKKCDKTNYRPASILSNILKIYEKLMYNQLPKFLINYFSQVNSDLEKGSSSQCRLLVILEKLKEAINKGNRFGFAFDCMDHKLLTAKFCC